MRWIEEPNASHPKWPYHVLVTEPGEPLAMAFVEYWKRILTDGGSLPPSAHSSLAIEIAARTFERDDPGYATAIFYSSLNKQSDGIGTYQLRGDYFNCIQDKGEDDSSFGRRQLVWLLSQYALLKKAVRDNLTWPLFEKISSPDPLAVRAGTSNGWFDLRLSQNDIGPLPANDQLLLSGQETIPDDPLQDLTGGVLDVAWMRLVQEFNAALIQYTPPHFKSIQCKITEGMEQGQRALFYDIQCPEFPDEGTTQPNARLHATATRLVQHLTAERGTFSGTIIKLDMQADGTWLHSIEFINNANS